RHLNGGDDRLGTRLDEVQHLVQAGLAGWLAELRDVGAGDEGPAAAHDDDGPHRGVADRLFHPVAQPLAHVLAERVDGRVIDGEHGHAAAAIEIDGPGQGCHSCFLSVRVGLQTRGWYHAQKRYNPARAGAIGVDAGKGDACSQRSGSASDSAASPPSPTWAWTSPRGR